MHLKVKLPVLITFRLAWWMGIREGGRRRNFLPLPDKLGVNTEKELSNQKGPSNKY